MRKRIYDYDYFADEAPESTLCKSPDCKQEGLYPAPVTKNGEREYQLFCMDHVRERNKQWNYFEGMSAGQMRAFEKDVECGHRPTRSMHSNMYIYTAQAQEQLNDLMYDHAQIHIHRQQQRQHFSAEEQGALEILQLSPPVARDALKQRYKELVKRYHPDVNQGDNASEEQFRDIVEAYQLLSESDAIA